MKREHAEVTQRVTPMALYEVKKVRLSLIAMMIIGGIFLALCIGLNVHFVTSARLENLDWKWVFVPYVGIGLGYIVTFYKWFPLPFEYRKGTKVVADTTVIRLKKLGFFDDDASEGGLSATMLGSVYYLYVKDPTRRSGQRKFRIKKNLYDMLRPGDEVTIGYLPKTCMMFYLDRGSFHYEPTRRVKGT